MLITFLSKVNYTVSNAIVIVIVITTALITA